MIIGLTGSIASGKSTVSKMLKEKGFPIVDADKIARLVVEPGSPVLHTIEQTFGTEVLQADGQLDRPKLGAVIFGDEEKRRQLNAIIHPAIRAEMLRQKEAHLAAGAKTVVMDIPLLFESQLQSYVERIIVVSVTKETQLKRLMSRDQLTEKEALERIQSQLPMAEKEAAADAVLRNDGSVEETQAQLDDLLFRWKLESSHKSE